MNFKNASLKLRDNKYSPWETAKQDAITNVKPNTFKGCDLSGKSFAGSEIAGCDFSGADLSGVDFRDALINGERVIDLMRNDDGSDLVDTILGSYKKDKGKPILENPEEQRSTPHAN